MQQIELALEPYSLNPVREPEARSRVTVYVAAEDGTRRVAGPDEYRVSARTKHASGNVPVVAIDGTAIVPLEGGIATIEATMDAPGGPLSASADLVVRPFYHDYHQTMVLKLFLGMEGEPTDELKKQPLFQRQDHGVLCTFDEALDVIRRTDNLTRGIPKIVYLVGWQEGGHDHQYPAWGPINPRMKSPKDADARESIRRLIREARRYNTTVSLHINMVDAYDKSPLWDEYLQADCVARNEDGTIISGATSMKGEPIHNLVYPIEWKAGLAQRRIDGLLELLPELREGHTIHIDVFIAQRENGAPISPWHAKPENGGLLPDDYVRTQWAIFHYWRDRGIDVTGEGILWAHPPGEDFGGLQPMAWWYPSDTAYQMAVPECLMARGRTSREGDGDFRFASSMHGEEIWNEDRTAMPGFLGMFCRTTLIWHYLSRLERLSFDGETLTYSDGVVARVENGVRVIRRGDVVLRKNDDLFVPALWGDREIIAYSRTGYCDVSWLLPEDWQSVDRVDVATITMEGTESFLHGLPVVGRRIVLSLKADEAVSITPAT